MLPQNAEHDFSRFFRISRPMHLATAQRYIALELFKQGVEVCDRVIANSAALFTQTFPVPVAFDRAGPAQCEMGLQAAKRNGQRWIVQGLSPGFAEALWI